MRTRSLADTEEPLLSKWHRLRDRYFAAHPLCEKRLAEDGEGRYLATPPTAAGISKGDRVERGRPMTASSSDETSTSRRRGQTSNPTKVFRDIPGTPNPPPKPGSDPAVPSRDTFLSRRAA
jgi:hypothetical protein